MSEPVKLLKDAVGYPEKEIEERFIITEEPTQWVIKAFRYLDGPTWGKIMRIITERGGGYRKDEKTKMAIFTLPKTEIPKENQAGPTGFEPGTLQVKTEEEGEYVLSRSLKGKLGQLVPCLKDATGITFDGLHREKLIANPWTVKLDHVKTPVDRAMARMTVNFCRRHYTSEEMKNDIGLLIGAGYTVQQISEVTGISERTVYRYMPEEMKKPEAKAISEGMREKAQLTAVSSSIKTSDTFQPSPSFARTQQEMAQQVIDCEACGKPMDRSRATIVGGKIVCPKCAGKDKPLTPRKLEQEPTFKPKEKPEFRRAVMQPQKSKFELAVIQELQAEGLPLETDQEFCVQKTTPDAILKLKDRTIAIYIDNVATHQEGDEKDEFLRSRLEKLHPEIHVCVVQYKNDSAEERQRAKEKIKEFLKW